MDVIHPVGASELRRHGGLSPNHEDGQPCPWDLCRPDSGSERTFLQRDAESAAESVALFFNGLKERGVDDESAQLFTQDWMELRFRTYNRIVEDE